MFLHLSVILFTGGGLYPSMQWADTPHADTPPWADIPWQTAPPPPGRHPLVDKEQTPPRQTPPPPTSCPLKWAVRILLECILVLLDFLLEC